MFYWMKAKPFGYYTNEAQPHTNNCNLTNKFTDQKSPPKFGGLNNIFVSNLLFNSIT